MKTPLRRSAPTCLVLALLAISADARGQADSPWVGKRVFTQNGTVLRVGGQVVDDEKRGNDAASGRDRRTLRVYRVEHVNGPWLWLQDEGSGASGWVEAARVVLYEQAIDFYTDQLRANPQSSTYNSRGVIWKERGEIDIAVADYNEAIRLDPANEIAYLNRGNAWLAKKEYDKAVADYNEAIRLDPQYALAFNNRGIAWRAKKEYDKAVADYGEAIRLDPRFALAFTNRGAAWRDKKDYDKAVADYGEAIRLDPKYALAYLNRGWTWRAKKEYDKAVADYGEAIRLDPKDAAAFNDRGIAWRAKKEYDKAVADYGEAIRLNPKSSSAFTNLAWLLATCPDAKYRDGKRAVQMATRACELTEWKDSNDLENLAAAHAESADFDKAVEWQEKANTLYSEAGKKELGRKLLALYRDRKPYRSE